MLWCRCRHDMKKHFDESVLSKLPNNYQDILKQSITSEEDDMGTQYLQNNFFDFFFHKALQSHALAFFS